MTAGLIQTLWADVIACTLRDAGVPLVVISPGSRSTPLVAALERAKHPDLVTIIDERAAAFYALGAARATGKPAALVCTSGSAVAHYLPALVEAAHAGVPLIAITADRPPELQHCGASQTIDQREIYSSFVRASLDLGTPSENFRAVRRTVIQAIAQALGPDPGPVHLNVPLRKPLEPMLDEVHALTATVRELLAQRPAIAAPTLAPDARALEALARAVASEPRGLIVAGALPAQFAGRDLVFELARRSGYPIVAEAGSQLRLCARPDDVTVIDAFDVIATHAPHPALLIQLGSEPVAAAWPAFLAASRDARRTVLAGTSWHDAESSATVILGDVATTIRALADELALAERTTAASLRRRVERDAASSAWRDDWKTLDHRGREALDRATRELAANEVAVMRDALAALPANAMLQIGNSLPIRTIDHASVSAPQTETIVLTQRGAAGIDGLIASAAGATQAGRPVLLVLGDVSFAHDLGGLLAARAAVAPLAILVIDNAGGRIFDGLPVAKAELGDAFAKHWTTAPGVDVVAIARALGLTAMPASPETIGYDVATAISSDTVTVIHAPVSPTGAREVRARAIELAKPEPRARVSQPVITRSSGPIETGERP